MALKQNTRVKIDNLTKAIIEGQSNDDSAAHGGYMFIVTSTYSPEDEGEFSGGLFLVGETAKLYQETLQLLEEDSAVEHLTSANLRDALASFAVSLEADSETLRGGSARRERIAQFVAEIAQPLSTYEIAFTVDGMIFGDDDPLKIGEVEFRNFSSELAEEWDLESISSPFPFPDDKMVARPAAIAKVQAGTLEKALERGESDIDRALQVLRTSIGYFRPSLIYDSQLLQRRGDLRVIRQLEPDTKLWKGWKGRRRPIDTELSGALLDSTRDFVRQLSPLFDGSIPPKLRDALLRSLDWIGTSITRDIYDHKVVDLCTALEAILSGSHEGEKGEAVALRVMLLSMALGKGVRKPGDLLQLYVLRSRIVHGSELGESGKSDYYSLKSIAEETILNIIELHGSQSQLSRPYDVFTFLETPERLDKAVSWLSQLADSNTREIAKYASGLQRTDTDDSALIVLDL